MSNDIWRTFPQLVAGVLLVESITSGASVDAPSPSSVQYNEKETGRRGRGRRQKGP